MGKVLLGYFFDDKNGAEKRKKGKERERDTNYNVESKKLVLEF